MAGSLKSSPRAALEVGDPDGAVDGRAADRAVALGDDLARRAAQRALAVGAEEVERRARRRRRARPGGPRRHGRCGSRLCGRVRSPSRSRASAWRHQRARPGPMTRGSSRSRAARRPAPSAIRRMASTTRLDRGAADLVAVQAALARLARRERARGPDVAAVDLAARPRARSRPTRSSRARSPSPARTGRGRRAGRGARPGSGASSRSTRG